MWLSVYGTAVPKKGMADAVNTSWIKQSILEIHGCHGLLLRKAGMAGVTVVSSGTWGPRVRSDRGKSWEPAHHCTITCNCLCLVTFYHLLAGSITSSCSTWVIVRLHVLPS